MNSIFDVDTLDFLILENRILTFSAVFGVLYANSGAAGVNWNPNLLDPIQGNDYFSQPGNETSHNYFSSTADISTYNTITVEFWSNVVGIGGKVDFPCNFVSLFFSSLYLFPQSSNSFLLWKPKFLYRFGSSKRSLRK